MKLYEEWCNESAMLTEGADHSEKINKSDSERSRSSVTRRADSDYEEHKRNSNRRTHHKMRDDSDHRRRHYSHHGNQKYFEKS